MSPLRREWGVDEANGNGTAGRPSEPPAMKRHGNSVLGVTTANRSRPASILSYTNQSAVFGQPVPRPTAHHHDRSSEMNFGGTLPQHSYHHHQQQQQQQQQLQQQHQNSAHLARTNRQSQRHFYNQQQQQQSYLHQQQQQQPYLQQPQPGEFYPPDVGSFNQPVHYPPPPPYSTMPRYPSPLMAPPVQARRNYHPELIGRYDKSSLYPQTFEHQHQNYLQQARQQASTLPHPHIHQQPYPQYPSQLPQHQIHRQSMRHYPQNGGGFTQLGANTFYPQGHLANPVDCYPQIGNDLPPSPQSVELEVMEQNAPFICSSFSRLEVFIKFFAVASLLFPPTGIGAVVCAFTANKESNERFRSARHKVALILASVGFTAVLFIIVTVIIATQVVK